MEIKKLYSQAIGQAKTALDDVKRVQENQLKLQPSDYNIPDDYEQEKQENSNDVYQHVVYIGALETMAKNLSKQGINVII